ncbi:hypothetical protein PDESU_03100 [Pontiella desulfatans]|uniref:Uncharacterized protein n=1 Tax=Pontiella desulfatans TaxID=2750659 RepID=A0A6C2U3X4_PONDE|nr:hypothetical protein [Pontiella desulfatans]VGO14537.1 hypothetical protein PDESU_03100 [Pontiella desulfatans]
MQPYPTVYPSMTIWGIIQYAGWSGIIAMGIMLFYSIPMGIMGRKNLEKRSSFILRTDDICKLLVAIFFMFTAVGFVEQFYPIGGMDDRSLRYAQFITSIASSAFCVFFAITITRLIKILLMKNKKDSNNKGIVE